MGTPLIQKSAPLIMLTTGLAQKAIYSAHTMTLLPSAFRIIVVCSLLFTCMGLFGCSNADAQDAVSLEFARTEHEAGRAVLIDIREPSEHVTGVAKGAQLLPMSQLNSRLGEIPKDSGNPVFLICNTQNRSGSTLTALKKAGYTNVKYVNGGMSGWVQRGWPTVKP